MWTFCVTTLEKKSVTVYVYLSLSEIKIEFYSQNTIILWMKSKQLHSGYPHESDRLPGQLSFVKLYGIMSRLCMPVVSWLCKFCVYVCHDASIWIFLHEEMWCVGHISSLSNQLFPAFICFQRLRQWYTLHTSQNLICSAVLRLFPSGLSGRAFKERPSQGDMEKVK